MGTARRIVGGALLVLFVGVLLSRPLLANPAFAGLLEGGLFERRTLLYLPLAILAVLVVVGRLRSTTEEGRSNGEHIGRSRRANASAKTNDDSGANILAGQGGTRDKSFEIEDEPPDAELRYHLEHLRTELGNDREVADDLATLEALAETEETNSIPKRCPREYCDAIWAERTVLGIGGGKYEVLDDDQVRCLECEGIVTLDCS